MSTSQKEDAVIVQGQAVPSDEIAVSLPQGSNQTGLTFSPDHNLPLHVQQVNTNENPGLEPYVHAVAGKYVVALRLTDLGVTVSHIRSPTDMDRLLAQTVTQKRQLVLSNSPPVLNTRIARFLYVYELPQHQGARRHFVLDGFPPRIQSMQPTSALNVILRPGLYCISLVVPQRPDFQFDSGGFTAFALEEKMDQTAHIAGRWFSLTEENPVPPAAKKPTPWFDWGGLRPWR